MIYLDHHAGTPLAPQARDAMERALSVSFANPASVHSAGRAARAELERARSSIGAALGARTADVVLTAGGSEACQLGIESLARRARRIVTTTIEHPAVARTIDRLELRGIEVMRMPVDGGHAPTVEALADSLDEHTLLAVQWVNHEVGTLLPVEALALRCRSAGAQLFVDATQAVGKLPVDAAALGAGALALASHKVGGPSGAGALVFAPGVDVEPVLLGGGQERGRRAGTPSLEPIVGFGAAMTLLTPRIATMAGIAAIRDELERGLVALGASVNAAAHDRVATVSNVSFPGRRGTVLVAALDLEGVCVSSGPACSSGLDQPSPTVLALYPDEAGRAASSIRFSLGPETTAHEVRAALACVERVLSRPLPGRT